MKITTYGDADASTVLLQMVDGHDLAGLETEMLEIRRLTDAGFCVRAFQVENWNHNLSPWTTPAVFGGGGFGDGAADTLSEVLKYTEDRSKTYYIGGYSLAGLFALWSAYQTDVFKGVAAASPSVWFPTFVSHRRVNKSGPDFRVKRKAVRPVLLTSGLHFVPVESRTHHRREPSD